MALGAGPFFSAFNQSYLASRQLANQEQRQGLEEAITLDNLRKQQQEQEDVGMLASAFQARRAAAATPAAPAAPPPPQMPPPPTSQLAPDQMAGLENAGVPLAPPASIAPGAPAGAPAGEPQRRKALIESVDPRVAGRLLGTQRGRAAIRDLEEVEKEHETYTAKQKANDDFTQANASIKDGDALGFYNHMARAMRTLGDYKSAAQYTEHAMNLRGDEKESAGTAEDLQRWLKANAAHQADPSPETYQAVLDELAIANTKSSRALRMKIGENMLAKTFNQNPKLAMFNKGVTQAYLSAWEKGEDVDAEKILRDAAKANPDGFKAVLFDAFSGQHNLSPVMKKVLRWEVPDFKNLDQEAAKWAWQRTAAQAKQLGLPIDDPKVMELHLKNLTAAHEAITRKSREADEEDKARKELMAYQTQLRQVRESMSREQAAGQSDAARLRRLREEEAALIEEVQRAEERLGQRRPAPPAGKAPEAEPAKPTVEIPVNPPPTKFKPTDEKYKKSMQSEWNRLKVAGYTRDQILNMMKKRGWQ